VRDLLGSKKKESDFSNAAFRPNRATCSVAGE